MKPVVIGAIIAAAAVGAFVVGMQFTSEQKGPAEQLGETLDNTAEEIREGLEQVPQTTPPTN